MPDFIKNFIADAERENRKRTLRSIIPLSPAECILDGKKVLNFSSNDYLGLSWHPLLKEEALKWMDKYGSGSTASRLVCGTNPAIVELEEKIAEWKKSEAALIFGSGYLANAGIISALANRETIIFADKLNHSSLNSGCLLSGAKFRRYRHNDIKALKDMLDSSDASTGKLIVSDTVFSMDGDIAPIEEIYNAARDNNTLLFLDDAHATGVFGENGEGLAHADAGTVVMGTFSKAMGSYGAYAACSKELKEYLVNRCSTFIYSTALPPSVCGSISAALKLVRSSEFAAIRTELKNKSDFLREELKNIGYDTGAGSTQIIPLIINDTERTLRLSDFLLKKGILAIAIRPPTVPENSSRIRISLNASHSHDNISFLLKALADAKKELL
ncbi:MAG: 8-amino-7-oxononanoate synthase [Lentisphaerae bacterium GWF2_44_16]|nr:MAG: 8-amino-7-oxononanoate synthase [Lentisphaerae bacterium GWF2_44_16]